MYKISFYFTLSLLSFGFGGKFKEEYLEIFSRKREYYEGPGNELSRTDYGKYTTELDVNGNYITVDNIFDKLIGKCSVNHEEKRAAGASYTAQEFNVLNDLNAAIIRIFNKIVRNIPMNANNLTVR